MKELMIKNIDCKYPIEIERKEIYPAIYEYILPDGFYFESCGTNFGNHIYAGEVPENHYVIRKKDETNTN